MGGREDNVTVTIGELRAVADRLGPSVSFALRLVVSALLKERAKRG